MTTKTILLVEDNPQDERLTLRSLRKVNLTNRIDVARDGRQALDSLFREGEFAETVARLGVYWLAANEPLGGR